MGSLPILRFSSDPNINGIGLVFLVIIVIGFVLTHKLRLIRCPNEVIGEQPKKWLLSIAGTTSLILGIIVVRQWLMELPWFNDLLEEAGFLVVIAMAVIALQSFVLLILLIDRILLRFHTRYHTHFAREATSKRANSGDP